MNRQREFFCREYVVDFNGTRAAIAAKYSPNCAGSIANTLLKDVEVMTFIGELLQGMHSHLARSPQEILQEMERVAFADRRKITHADGRMKQLHEIDDETAAALDGYEIGENGVKYKFTKKAAALKMLGDFHNMFEKHQRAGAAQVVVNIEGKDAKL